MRKNNLIKFIGATFLYSLLLSCSGQSQQVTTLKEALNEKFLIGTALNKNHITGGDLQGVEIIKQHFNSIVAENCMKSALIHPKEDQYNFSMTDSFVDFGIKNNMFIIGHTLIWHSQVSRWFFVDENGNEVSSEVLKQRMKEHITTVVGRYKGRIKGWDVVNEAFLDDGSFRKTKFYKILGEEYITLAFQYAHEADPDAELYYNDFSMAKPDKRNAVVELVKNLKSKGVRIDAVGMQGHFTMDFPLIDEFEKSILAFAETGVKVMITELDMSALPNPHRNMGADISDRFEYRSQMNPYQEGLPDSVSIQWTNRMNDFFKLFLKYHDIIERVTLWGVNDNDSWRNNWPIFKRTDYPLLFDRKYQPKAVVDSIIKEAQINN